MHQMIYEALILSAAKDAFIQDTEHRELMLSMGINKYCVTRSALHIYPKKVSISHEKDTSFSNTGISCIFVLRVSHIGSETVSSY